MKMTKFYQAREISNYRIAKDLEAYSGSILLSFGQYLGSEEETLNHLLDTHYPGFKEEGEENTDKAGRKRLDWGLAAKVISPEKAEWAVRSFTPFQASGADSIYPAPLQKELRILTLQLI